MSEFVHIEGTLSWVRNKVPEEFNGKESWKVTIHPTKESMDIVMGLQAKGVKNTLKKDDAGYYINYSRPVARKNKAGKVLQSFDPPKIYDAEGKVIDDLIGNGSEGVVRLEVYEHKAPNGGKSHAARWDSAKITKLIPYVGAAGNSAPSPQWPT